MKKCFIRAPQGPFVTKRDLMRISVWRFSTQRIVGRRSGAGRGTPRRLGARGGERAGHANEAAKPSERRKANNRQTRMERGHNETGTTRETS